LESDVRTNRRKLRPEDSQSQGRLPGNNVKPVVGLISLNIFYMNIQGLRDKVNEIEVLVKQEHYSVLCFSEHWCDADEISFNAPEGYYLSTCFCRKDHIRGGVCVFLAKSVLSEEIDVKRYCDELNFEVSVVKLIEYNILIVALYRSPNGKVNAFLTGLEDMLKFLTQFKCRIVICGDVNADFDVTTNKASVINFTNLLRQFNLFCTNFQPTRGLACLDNIITDLPQTDYNTIVLEPNLSDHKALHCEVKIGLLENTNIVKRVRKFSTENVNRFQHYLSCFDWAYLFEIKESAEVLFCVFFQEFMSAFELCFPLQEYKINNQKNRTNTSKHANWYSPELEKMKNEILFCKCIAAQTKSKQLLEKIKHLQKQYRKALTDAKKAKNEEIIESSANRCRAAWSIIKNAAGKSSHRSSSGIPPDEHNSYFVSSVEEISSKVKGSVSAANQFLSVLAQPAKKCDFSMVTTTEVRNIVMSLKNTKSKDVYGLNSILVKSVIDYILEPLTYCINCCLYEGIFPSPLKFSRVVPIYKKGPVTCPSSFRPISCVPIFSKILEKILKVRICNHFESLNLFSSSQFGYRSGLSTIKAVDSLVNQVISALEMGSLAQITLCDLSKAFDCVRHDILVEKLRFYGFHDRELEMLKSYLVDRNQVVEVEGRRSQVICVNRGVPQGSILGPILFLILMNDLPDNLLCKTIIYADDTTLLNVNEDNIELKHMVASSLADSVNWFSSNSLYINESKTCNLKISFRDIDLENCSTVKLLGINIDSRLSWKDHIHNVCKQLSRVIYLLANLKKHVSDRYLRMAYFAFFESLLRYGLILWGNGVGIEQVLIMQKKAIRILSGAGILDHCKPLFVKTGILTVINLYIYEVLIVTKRNSNSLLKRNEIHQHNTRNKFKLEIPKNRLSVTNKYYRSLGIKLFNKLPLEFQSVNENVFNVRLYSWLQSRPFYKVDEFFNSEMRGCEFGL
jgi:hypothetical protein